MSNLWNEEQETEARFAWRGVIERAAKRAEIRHKASENRGNEGKEHGGRGMIRGFVPVDFEALLKLGFVSIQWMLRIVPREFGLVDLNRGWSNVKIVRLREEKSKDADRI